jgi:hypothetical protein
MRAHAGQERLGRYRLREKLGEGGMGVVYLASDSSGEPVAVKVLRQGVPSEATARRRLAREVDTMRRVHSPYVAEVLDADVEGDPPYIVTRYVAGQTLENVVADDGPLSGEALASLARGLSAALLAVHSAGVVHRDLKPGNVMLVDGRPVVIDFGIAQAPDSTRLTMTGMFMGTPGYLAPEVIEGRAGGAAADVHSWGATMSYAATGRPPFGTGQFEAIFYRIVHGQPDLDGMPAPLLPLVVAALARDPARRPGAAELHEFAASLDPKALVPGPTTPAAVLPPAVAAGNVDDGQAIQPGPAGAAAGVGRAIAGTGSAGWPIDPTVQDHAAMQGLAGMPSANGMAPANGMASASGTAAAAGGRLAWADTRPLAAQSPADFADLLTPVRYGEGNGHRARGPTTAGNGNGAVRYAEPPAMGVQQAAAHRQPPGRGTATEPAPSRWPLVLVTMAVLVAASVLLPIAGTAAALVVLMALRAADLTSGWLGKRRRAQGPRATDLPGALAFFPLALLRSALRLIGLAPLALLCAAAAAVLAVLVGGASALPRAGAFAAGALIACYCFGPGSGASRRPLNKAYGSVARSTFAGVAGGIGLTALAAAAVIAAARLAPGYWPAIHLGNQLQTANVSHTALSRLPGHLSDAARTLLHWLRHQF